MMMAHEVSREPAARESLAAPIRAADRRILVVEDDDEMREMVSEFLKEEGYRVFAEPDTLSGLIRLLGEGADAIVVDWKMPDLDGFELLGTVARCYPEQPVIFMTAYASMDVRIRAMEAGAFAFLPKPFRRVDLLAEIERALDFARSRTESKATPVLHCLRNDGDLERRRRFI